MDKYTTAYLNIINEDIQSCQNLKNIFKQNMVPGEDCTIEVEGDPQTGFKIYITHSKEDDHLLMVCKDGKIVEESSRFVNGLRIIANDLFRKGYKNFTIQYDEK